MFFKEHALAWCAWNALLLQKFPARAHTREGRLHMMHPQLLLFPARAHTREGRIDMVNPQRLFL